jgi:hypothetical protein
MVLLMDRLPIRVALLLISIYTYLVAKFGSLPEIMGLGSLLDVLLEQGFFAHITKKKSRFG